MNKEYAYFLLNKNKEDYNRMAPYFDLTRNYIPKDYAHLTPFIKENEKILDLGCGNGRLSEIILNPGYIGVDVSEETLRIAQKKYPNRRFKLMDDPLIIPFEDNYFDSVFCLSVLHHVPSKYFRKKYIEEICRVLKTDGKLIITAWNLKRDKKAMRLVFKYLFLKILGKSELGFRDIFYPWKDSTGKTIAERYVHIFSLIELVKLLKSQGFRILEQKAIDRSQKGSNLLVVCQKCS
jgi:alkylated DNA repair protein alkB family protein 8